MKHILTIMLLLPLVCKGQGFEKIQEFSFTHCITTEGGIKGEPKPSLGDWVIGKFKQGDLGWLHLTPGNPNEVFAISDFKEKGNEVIYDCKYIFPNGKTVPVTIQLYTDNGSHRLVLTVKKTRYEYIRK